MARVLLLVPTASYRATDFQAAARALGAEVVIGTERRLAISAFAEDACLVVDLDHPREAADVIAAFHQRHPLDAVVGVDDQGVLAAAHAARRLGLRGNDPSAAGRTRNKAEMRAALSAHQVRQPAYRLLPPGADAGAVADEVGWPCVLKPLSAAASRGVIRADDAQGARSAAERIRAMLSSSVQQEAPLLVERYVSGFEVAVEGILEGGELRVLALLDKPDPMEGPYFEETLLITPSRLPEAVQSHIRETTARATAALGLTEGPIHAELRVAEEQATVLEVAARSIGGLCSRALRFGAGMALEEVILRHALGFAAGGTDRERASSGVMMIPVPRAGLLREVRGLDDACAVPGVTEVEITIAPTRPLRPLPEGDRYLGFIFAREESPDRVEASLRSAHERLEIVIDDLPSTPARHASRAVRSASR